GMSELAAFLQHKWLWEIPSTCAFCAAGALAALAHPGHRVHSAPGNERACRLPATQMALGNPISLRPLRCRSANWVFNKRLIWFTVKPG
ncbi:hypothetical protein, partial [Pantoea endophytica]|uniref:hypothetical protein n=1 Tax=Pantoea endophytica TaxID=92488 RepID=UPI00289C07A3